MATTRLRKTFKYPEDDESDGVPDGIDEQGKSTSRETIKLTECDRTRRDDLSPASSG
jgi:hypothetical protein